MPLDAGARLGPYEIVALLGAGGMGEVYRAQDVRLGREVALKVVAGHLAATSEVRKRFAREARAIASLSHPHICALFDVGTHEDSDFLVMELLQGESLADKLKQGPLPLEQVLRCGAQILDALDRAHRAGIVHRDLKPGNVMLTKGGVKLLDFGLAQLRAEDPKDPSYSVGPTRVAPLTGQGTILGTLQYMAPEQLEGQGADARSDLFAFGAVLYEMVTGELAFPGTTMASVISKILRDQPPPISERNVLAPPGLERLVARCLEKDPEDRWQSAHDLRIQLQDLANPDAARGDGGAIGRARPRWRAVTVAAAVVAAAIGVTAGYLLSGKPAAAPRPPVRLELPPPPGTTFRLGGETSTFAVSPDGEVLAFIANSLPAGEASAGAVPSVPSVWVRPLAELEPRRLDATEGATSLFWSPDGSEIGFFAGGRLKRTRLDGTSTVAVCEVPVGAGLAGTWGRDQIVFGNVQGEALYRVAFGAATPEKILVADPERDERRVYWPWFLPNGVDLLYVAVGTAGEGHLSTRASDGSVRVLGPLQSRVEVIDPDLLVFAHDGALIAQRLDLDQGRLVGAPVPIAPHVTSFRATQWAAFSASRNGTLIIGSGRDNAYLAWFDESGKELAKLGDRGQRLRVQISTDGRRALSDFYERDSENYDIHLLDLERNVETALVSSSVTEVFPLWIDDRTFVYGGARPPPPRLFVRDLESGEEQSLFSERTFQIPANVTRDRRLLFLQRGEKGGFGLYAVDLDASADSRTPSLLLPESAQLDLALLSPDESLLAFVGAESGRSEAYLRPFEGTWAPQRVSTDGASVIGWSRDGRRLLYTTPDRRFLAAPISTTPSLRIGTPVELFALPGLGWSTFDVAPDGRILAVVESEHANEKPLAVVTGWSPER